MNGNFDYIVKSNHFNYLLLIKLYNTINLLVDLIYSPELFCSQLKILRELYKTRIYNPTYNFEAVFETLIGYELSAEQQIRFNDIIYNYTNNKITHNKKEYNDDVEITNIINYEQIGGHIYPLHHFMMGKGKSAIMTPLLMGYFSLIENKNPYIIVPEHLLNNTKADIEQYKNVFDINVKVMSDSEIKYKFLEGYFMENNADKVFIIDEFDSLLDPIKSNYNIVDDKVLDTTTIYQFIKKIVDLIKLSPTEDITIRHGNHTTIKNNIIEISIIENMYNQKMSGITCIIQLYMHRFPSFPSIPPCV
jgi:hypothetical protein